MKNIKFLIFGVLFGIILIKSQVVSWFRIQEMFRFQAFHMYGIIGSAVVVGAISILIIKRLQLKASDGNQINLQPKAFTKGTLTGGIIFGFGWALTGACPGPLYALIGSGYTVILVALLSALAGTLVYGLLRKKLPH
jgi:uncharacterized protein